MERITLKVRGLDCPEEESLLRGTVGKLGGVEALEFDVFGGKMSVEYDPAKLGMPEIEDSVHRAGLSIVKEGGTSRAKEPEQDVSFWERYGQAVIVISSAAFLSAGFLAHYLLHGFVDALTSGAGRVVHAYPPAVIALYVVSIVLAYRYVAPKALLALRNLKPDMNLLMSVAVIGAAILGEWFEAAAVAFLFAVSLALESWSVSRARRAVQALMDLSPETARCVDKAGEITETPVGDVEPGTTVSVRPGEKFPLDGAIVKGATSVNQAPITGESLPVPKEAGDVVYAGTINNEGAVEFETSKPASKTTLAGIIRLVEEARSRRAPTEKWVEKFARYYTPLMFLVAALIAIVIPAFFGDWSRWFYFALVILVIACPCALVISTPVSIVAGLARAARAGVLVKGGLFLEAPAGIKVVALDKTGTLTLGVPEVREIVPLNDHTPRELLESSASMEKNSKHPIAQAIVRKAELEGISVTGAEGFRDFPGKGAEAMIDGRRFWIGSHRMMHEEGHEWPEYCERANELESAGCSLVAVGTDDHVCGLFCIGDGVRSQARDSLRELKLLGVEKTVMLTGDNERAARAVAEVTGVDEYWAELLPEDKVGVVEELVKKHGSVAMVGDGVNDAPALAAATLGIAMGAAGSDAAIETADIALMSDDLSKLPWLIAHSKRTLGIIKANIWFALGLKAVFMILALAGIATLWMAIAADMGASLAVIGNSLRLLGGRK